MQASMASFYANQGGAECMVGDDFTAIPITIDDSRLGSASNKVVLKAPYLYARRTASPYTAVPFCMNAVVSSAGNTTNAVVDVPDADAVKFKVNDACTYITIATGVLYATETKAISAISAAGGGTGGAGFTKITFTGVWTTPPTNATTALVVADGSEQSANVVLVTEDVEFDASGVLINSRGIIVGTALKAKVNNTTYFDQSKNQTLKLVVMQ